MTSTNTSNKSGNTDKGSSTKKKTVRRAAKATRFTQKKLETETKKQTKKVADSGSIPVKETKSTTAPKVNDKIDNAKITISATDQKKLNDMQDAANAANKAKEEAEKKLQNTQVHKQNVSRFVIVNGKAINGANDLNRDGKADKNASHSTPTIHFNKKTDKPGNATSYAQAMAIFEKQHRLRENIGPEGITRAEMMAANEAFNKDVLKGKPNTSVLKSSLDPNTRPNAIKAQEERKSQVKAKQEADWKAFEEFVDGKRDSLPVAKENKAQFDDKTSVASQLWTNKNFLALSPKVKEALFNLLGDLMNHPNKEIRELVFSLATSKEWAGLSEQQQLQLIDRMAAKLKES